MQVYCNNQCIFIAISSLIFIVWIILLANYHVYLRDPPWRQLIWLITQLIRQTNKTFLNFRFGKHSSYQLESHTEDKALQGGPKTRLELPNGPTIETGEENCKKIFLSLKNIIKMCILSISILIYSQRNPTKQVWTSGLSVQILA